MSAPRWLTEARRHLGVAEITGPRHSPVIQSWLHKLRAWWVDDETPWCGVFVAACMYSSGFKLPKFWMRAKAWADWGTRLIAPAPGCIVVFERQGGGHVGFVVGRTVTGQLLVLGGNQGNRVSEMAFDPHRVIAYVWPPGEQLPWADLAQMPAAEVSRNEA